MTLTPALSPREREPRRSVILGWLALAALGSSCSARAQDESAKPTQIVLRPAKAPVPALKYQLLPERRTLVPGNAAIFYHRAVEVMLDKYASSRAKLAGKKPDPANYDDAAIEAWLNGSLSAIPRARAQRLLEDRHNALREVELGARRQSCDWDFDQREEGVYLLIQEISEMRGLIRLVSLKARMAVLAGHNDLAFHWIQTGFAMARHASSGPLLIQSLVGVSLSQTMSKALEDLIQAPGAPNFFWALSHRPRPLTDFSGAFESERFLLEREVPSLGALDGPAWSVEKGRMFAAELQEKLFRLAEISDGSGKSELRNWRNRLGMAGLVLQVYPEAKRALIAQGRPAEQVEAMPAVQVAALHTFQEYEQFRDEFFKWTSLPFYQGYKGMDLSLASFRMRTNQSLLFKLFTMLIPAVRSSGLALALSERRLDAIQCVEAIRLYAALHGKLPSHFDDIAEAPVPFDSATGKPFEFRLLGDGAILTAPYPPGGLDVPQHKINYELKLTR
jgi:hypothetical protein